MAGELAEWVRVQSRLYLPLFVGEGLRAPLSAVTAANTDDGSSVGRSGKVKNMIKRNDMR